MLNDRLARDTDRELVASLMNTHNLSVDTEVSHVDADTALGFINGYFSPNNAVLLESPQFSGLVAAVNMQPDPQRKTFQAELYCAPDFEPVEDVVDWVIRAAARENPEWQLAPGANAKDVRIIAAWSQFGFQIERRFSVMRLELDGQADGRGKPDITIKSIDTNNEGQLRTWHALHQNAFSTHFGFTPRVFEDWIGIVTRDPSFDPNGILVGTVEGAPVGFCHMTDEFSSDNRGFVIGLGVAQEHRGHGYGEALLQAGIEYAASRGYTSVELAVDTGNESGALSLYQNVGFEITSAWVHFSKKK